jgi:hypothetical protein
MNYYNKYIRPIIKKYYVKIKRYNCHRLYPIRINKKQLNDSKNKFDGIVEELISEIKDFQQSDYTNNVSIYGSVEERNFKILSYNGDKMGKVLSKDGRIYRGIYKESAESFSKLWNSGVLQVLANHHYLPQSYATEYKNDEYPIIIEHEIVTMSTSKMWNSLMIKDACINMCIIQRVCSEFGFTLHDGHLNNITFHNGKPIFTDIGSIVENKGQRTSFAQGLVFSGAYRCLFSQLNNSILKSIQTFDEENNSIWISPRYYDDQTIEYRYALKKYKRYNKLHSSILCNKIIHDIFDKYSVKPEYFDILFGMIQSEKVNELSLLQFAHKDVIDIISKYQNKIQTIVDVGGTQGRLAVDIKNKFPDKMIKTTEISYAFSEASYKYISEKSVGITSYLFHYLYGADQSSRDTIKSDLVICLDITNNLITFQDWKVDSLLNSIKKITNKYALITFDLYHNKLDVSQFEKNVSDFFIIIEKHQLRFGDNQIKCQMLYWLELKV